MVRKLAAALLGVGVLIPGLANALGLGEIRLNSALSEPLDAEIELVQVRELTSTEILPGLATNADFNAAGVERYPFLSDLRFEVVIGDKGRSYIKVRSRKPIKEPFLNFLVEVNWPAGRLLREYTMLLDPPLYSGRQAEPVRQAQTAAPAPRTAASAPRQTSAPGTPSSAPRASAAGGADSHAISSNDSLWSIAQKLKPSDNVTTQQTMIALQRHNPDAFIDDNINLLKRGQILRAPSEDQIQEISSREAIQMVAEQNRRWRDRIASRSGAAEAPQMDLSGRSADRPAPTARSQDEGRLKLLSGSAEGEGASGQSGTSAAGSGELRNQLARAEENADKFRLESEDLKVRMNDLQEQLETSEKVLTLKDQQIAALQAKLAELERQANEAGLAPASVPEPEATLPVEDEIAPDVLVEEPVDDGLDAESLAETPAEEEVTPVSPEVDFNYQEEALSGQEETPFGVEVVDEQAPADHAEEPAPGVVMEDDVAPVVQQPVMEETQQPVTPPAPPQQGLLNMIMSNPLYLGAAAGAVILLLAAALMAARRKKQEEVVDETIEDDFELPDNRAELQDEMDIDLSEPQDDIRDEEELPVEETVPQTADVLGEADIYIAYGRYPQAIEMLQNAAEKEPDRADIRMKLCEVSADANEPQTFMTHYRALQALGATALLAKADELRAKLAPDMGDDADEVSFEQAFTEEAPAEPLQDDAESFDFDISDDADATVIAAPILEPADSSVDFDLGELDDSGVSLADSGAAPQPAESTDLESADLDFDLAFDTDASDAAPATADTNDLDFDLDMGELESAAPVAASEDDNAVTLDFDAEFALDDVESTSLSAPTSSFDGDLSLDFESAEAAPAAEATEDNSLDFDLDFELDTASTTPAAEPDAFDLDDDRTVAFTPSAPAAEESAEEPVLDSISAAQLADELDFDVTLDAPAEAVDRVEAGEEPVEQAAPFAATPLQPAANDLSGNADDELDFLSDADETSTKLDLARAYIDMGDRDGARDILDEVMIEGNDTQKQEAKELLNRLES